MKNFKIFCDFILSRNPVKQAYWTDINRKPLFKQNDIKKQMNLSCKRKL